MWPGRVRMRHTYDGSVRWWTAGLSAIARTIALPASAPVAFLPPTVVPTFGLRLLGLALRGRVVAHPLEGSLEFTCVLFGVLTILVKCCVLQPSLGLPAPLKCVAAYAAFSTSITTRAA